MALLLFSKDSRGPLLWILFLTIQVRVGSTMGVLWFQRQESREDDRTGLPSFPFHSKANCENAISSPPFAIPQWRTSQVSNTLLQVCLFGSVSLLPVTPSLLTGCGTLSVVHPLPPPFPVFHPYFRLCSHRSYVFFFFICWTRGGKPLVHAKANLQAANKT